MGGMVKYFILCALISGFLGCSSSNVEKERYITRDGLEPDRWASVWLMKTRIAPQAEVIVKPAGSAMDDGVPFAIPESRFKRTRNSTAFASLMEGYGLSDPALDRMNNILLEIETTGWGISGSEADVVEQSFRRMQDKYGKDRVPISCYMQFFEYFYEQAKTAHPLSIEFASKFSCSPGRSPVPEQVKREKGSQVDLVPISRLLDEIRSGRKVVFVDVREREEFEEIHIPGAMNIQLRNIHNADLQTLLEADRVVSYCIKDFRGYEVAVALARKGVKNSSTMKPYGLSGWRSLGLPVVLKGQSEEQGIRMLRESMLSADWVSP